MEHMAVKKNPSKRERALRKLEPDYKPRAKSPLTKEQEIELFKMLSHKTSTEAGKSFGLQDVMKNDGAIRIYVYNIVRRITAAPELYGISQDGIDIVRAALDARKGNRPSALTVAKEKEEFKDKLEVIRDTATDILSKKLQMINKNKNTLADVKLKEVSDILAMAVDKIRLVKGESTETVVHLSKMSLDDVSPEEAMKLVLKAREALVEGKK